MQEHPHSPTTSILTDLATSIGELEGRRLEQAEGWVKRLHLSVWAVLMLLGGITAIVGGAIDYVGEKLLAYRAILSFSGLILPSFILWMSYSLFFAFLATSACLYISPEAEGSGIPEMKSILSGSHIPRYFSLQTLTAKVIGLVSAYSAGLSIGREGPLVHIAGSIAHNLCRFSCFRHIATVTTT